MLFTKWELPVGLIAQLVEHCTVNAEVMGSIPVPVRTFFNVPLCLFILEMKYGGKHLIRRIPRVSHGCFHL